eukprot:scaffold7881_cov258-Pinguiococcus_pyrenoidosus.AAC.5
MADGGCAGFFVNDTKTGRGVQLFQNVRTELRESSEAPILVADRCHEGKWAAGEVGSRCSPPRARPAACLSSARRWSREGWSRHTRPATLGTASVVRHRQPIPKSSLNRHASAPVRFPPPLAAETRGGKLATTLAKAARQGGRE